MCRDLTISGGTRVLVKRLMSSPSAVDGTEYFRSSSSSRKLGTRRVVFFGATATVDTIPYESSAVVDESRVIDCRLQYRSEIFVLKVDMIASIGCVAVE